MSNSLWPHGLYSPWNSLGPNTGVQSCSLLQGFIPTQGLNPGFPHCRQILYQLSHQGSPRILKWVAYPFSSGSSQPRIRTGSPALQVDSLPAELPVLVLHTNHLREAIFWKSNPWNKIRLNLKFCLWNSEFKLHWNFITQVQPFFNNIRWDYLFGSGIQVMVMKIGGSLLGLITLISVIGSVGLHSWFMKQSLSQYF